MDTPGDTALDTFALQEEDTLFKVQGVLLKILLKASEKQYHQNEMAQFLLASLFFQCSWLTHTLFQIPMIKRAQALRSEPLKLFGSPWSAPAWMKSNNDFSGQGYLLPENYQPWANYFVK